MFTDGSKNNNGVSADVYCPSKQTNLKFYFGKIMSSYTAELYAIYKAIQFICGLKEEKIIICTDFKSSIEAIENSRFSFFE